MYNDEKNLYHYTYRKDGSESTRSREGQPSVDDQLSAFQSQNGPQQPIQEMKPVKKKPHGPEGDRLGPVLCPAGRRRGRRRGVGRQPVLQRQYHQCQQPAGHHRLHQNCGRKDGND